MMQSLPVEMRRMILEHFSNAELLTVSLVNKLFNNEARSLVSTRANLNADLGKPACQNVLSFLTHLKEMEVIPFSGMKIRWYSADHSELCARPQKKINPAVLGILDRVAWKRLSVTTHGGGQNLPKKCPALQLVQKILKDFSAVLEELELNNHPKLLRFIQEITEDRMFPKLKILKLEGLTPQYYDKKGTKKSFLNHMLARAPNLQEFHQEDPPDLSENLMEGSSSAVLMSKFEDFNPALHEFSEGFTGTVKLKEINLFYTDSFSMARFQRTVPRVLQSSFDTLRSIRINFAFLIPLMRCSGVRLNKVTDFTTYMDYTQWELMQPGIFTLLKQFDFTRVFPNLNKVGVTSWDNNISADHLTELVTSAVPEEPSPDRAINIKHLSMTDSLTPEAVPFLAKMFPDVQVFTITVRHEGQQVPYTQIWNHCVQIKELQVNSFIERNANVESDFCGVFPAEMALLREQDEEYLRTVHIVPVMPSITCLGGLRTLTIIRRFYNPSHMLSQNLDPMFSNVTVLIAFKRCPNLSVRIQTIWP